MLQGPRQNLADVNSIILSSSLARTLFGATNPLNQLVQLDSKVSLRVTGVYQDFPPQHYLECRALPGPLVLVPGN
ncbi:ABC transporter permease [Spirosoma lituiforme]